MPISAVTVAVRTVKSGMSARAGLLAARAANIAIRDATWFRLVGEVQRSLTNQIGEASAPLNRRPVGAEISAAPTRVATGYMQYVDVFVRDKASGAVSIRPFAVRTATLLTRQAVIARAVNSFQSFTAGPEPSYPETVLGAAYTATYRLTPGLGGGGGGGGGGGAPVGGGVTPTGGRAPTSDAGIRSDIAGAIRRLRPGGSGDVGSQYVQLADLRDALPNIPRADLDRVLAQLALPGSGFRVVPQSQQATLTPRDRSAALQLGGQANNAISMETP